MEPASTRKSVTGTVTKIVGDGATYGFINDEIFFQQTNVTSGGPAGVNDRVFAECEYSAHLPIKWNATSVKVIGKAVAGQQLSSASSLLESDPRKQPRQSLLNQQQQQQQQQPPASQFNQQQGPGPGVAVTYQQHRQQRQQLLPDNPNQHDNSMNQAPQLHHQQDHQHQQPRLLDQANNPEYFAMNNPVVPPFQQQQQPDIQPFQTDSPMGPPKLTYTSQLGSAFVQNPIIPPPFLSQQPQPMLPQQQQQTQPQQPQQQLLPSGNQVNNQNNQRQQGKGRFGNQNEKNDRQGNRGRNRGNDRGGDRDNNNFNSNNNSNNTNNNNNNNSNRGRNPNSRDRSAGRGNQKRDDPRPSPPAHSSARSSNSVSSDRGHNRGKRHYEVQNLPKSRIMTDLNSWNMRQRCPSSIHVPSDLKNIIVNQYFRLDIKNTPKPLKFKIEEAKTEASVLKDENSGENKSDETTSAQQTENHPAVTNAQAVDPRTSISVEEAKAKVDQPTPPSSKSDTKLNHKYGVKVILISLPELETIYKNVFGNQLDSYSVESRSHPRLDESISMLCNKGSNGGHSLIGGKFDPILDGFVEGETNEFERHGRQPDLIATCKRVVFEQTGLDLGSCRSWSLLSTFMYNNKSDYFSHKASVEYSYIYMPQIWTMVSDSFDESIIEKESLRVNISTMSQDIGSEILRMGVDEGAAKEAEPKIVQKQPEVSSEPGAVVEQQLLETGVTLENLPDLKVVDLKSELDKREVKYKPSAKKAELVALLEEILRTGQKQPEVEAATVADDPSTIKKQDEIPPEDQLEEGEVVADNTPEPEAEDGVVDTADLKQETSDNKRKACDGELQDELIEASKKLRTESSAKIDEKVELIKEPFVVKAREGQQQISLVTLYEAIQVSRYDQFELSVASNILRESLVQHLSEYIFTTLVEDNRQKMAAQGELSGATSGQSSQETNSDTNNNNSTSTTKQAFKNPPNVNATNEKAITVGAKELPVDRYINLALSYFDSNHMGYVHADDLSKLFNNTGLTISKRALISLIGEGDKFNYRTLADLSPKVAPTYVYRFPEQFNRLPGAQSLSENDGSTTFGKMIEYQGVKYDVEKLIQQVRDAETLRVSLVDRFNYAIENSDKQAEEIHVLEVSQKSLSRAIKSQNDDICELKRERDSIKKKYDSIRKEIKSAVGSLSELVKDEK